MHAISFELDYKRVQQQYQLSEYEITGRLIRLFDTEGFYMYRHNIFCTKNKDPLKRIYNMATKLGQRWIWPVPAFVPVCVPDNECWCRLG